MASFFFYLDGDKKACIVFKVKFKLKSNEIPVLDVTSAELEKLTDYHKGLLAARRGPIYVKQAIDLPSAGY